LKACFNPAYTRRLYCSFPSAGRSSSHRSRLKPSPARSRKIWLLQPNYRPGPAQLDYDQQQRARSLKSGPSRPSREPDRAASEGRLWSDDHWRQCYQYAWQGAILREY